MKIKKKEKFLNEMLNFVGYIIKLVKEAIISFFVHYLIFFLLYVSNDWVSFSIAFDDIQLLCKPLEGIHMD
jgi:hypothetical protein